MYKSFGYISNYRKEGYWLTTTFSSEDLKIGDKQLATQDPEIESTRSSFTDKIKQMGFFDEKIEKNIHPTKEAREAFLVTKKCLSYNF